MKKTIGVIGYGYVGKAIAAFFESSFDIVIYDPAQGLTDKKAVSKADLAVVCVPTPMSKDGSVDLSIIKETFAWLRAPAIVIKSTVPPGTTAHLAQEYNLTDALVFSPEYIGERGYNVPFWEGVPDPTNMKLHSFHILGGTPEAVAKVRPFFQESGGPFVKYHTTDSTTAELTKYMENTWIAAKVTYCNELYEIAETFGVDYNALRELWLLDGRVGRSHTLVYPDRRGFDGKCIPKDTNGIYRAAKKAGYDSRFLKTVLEENARFVAKNPK